MADEHDAALAWAQANPTDPRSQDIQAKAWAVKNPADPRSAAILSRLGGSEKTQFLSEDQLPGARAAYDQSHGTDDFFSRLKDPNRWKAIAGMQSGYPQPQTVHGDPPLAIPAGQAPAALLKAAEFMNGTAPRRIGMGGVQGAIADPEHPFQGAAKGAGLAAGGEIIGNALQAGGDATMQAAVGRKKFTPGVGVDLANEGVVGTRGMMQKQVANKLENRAGEMGDLAAQIPAGHIDSGQIGQEIADEGSRPFNVPGAAPSASDVPKIQKVNEFAQDVASRGAEDGSQGLQRRIAAGQRSYRGSEDPLQSLLGQLSKGEQIKYSQALKDGYRDVAPSIPAESAGIFRDPVGTIQEANGVTGSNPEALAQTDKVYGSLKRAQSSLDEPVSLPKSLMGLASQGLHFVPGGSAATSAIGQALVKGGQAVGAANNPILRDVLLRRSRKE